MRLRPASPAEKARRDRVTHAAWGERLEADAYAEREAGLRAHPWARAGMTTWLWTDGGDGILASCETFRMESRLRGHAGCTFGVASVFVEAHRRGEGHATAMMRALVDQLGDVPESQAVILFSDVGIEIYARAGFVARPAFETIVPAPAPGAASPDPAVTFLDEAAARAAAADCVPGGAFVVTPTPAQIDWHLERERLYARLLGRPRPAAWGATTGGAVAVWCGDLKNERLDVLLLDGEGSGRDALVAAAGRVAANAGLRSVVLWEGRTPRTSSLPMIAPLSGGLDPEEWMWIPRALWM
jgi:GNAT superfamily N-acetyltransferase